MAEGLLPGVCVLCGNRVHRSNRILYRCNYPYGCVSILNKHCPSNQDILGKMTNFRHLWPFCYTNVLILNECTKKGSQTKIAKERRRSEKNRNRIGNTLHAKERSTRIDSCAGKGYRNCVARPGTCSCMSDPGMLHVGYMPASV